jgi:steroid 5-alpha reductase family enzyme
MSVVSALGSALALILAAGFLAWLASLLKNDVSFVDSLWSLFFLLAGVSYAWQADAMGPAAWLVVVLLANWSLRLALHITVRNWGEGEDSRYQQIRKNNEPRFALKSLYIVFGLQGMLAFIISIPLLFAIDTDAGIGPLQLAATMLWLLGFVFEAGGDWQLMRFRQNRSAGSEQGAVLDTGLWRYSRHPNYFGDACIWWAFWLFAAASGAWWTIFSPLLMTVLLVKVSGVALLEKTIGDRRPGYADYVRRTSAFIPRPPRDASGGEAADDHA